MWCDISINLSRKDGKVDMYGNAATLGTFKPKIAAKTKLAQNADQTDELSKAFRRYSGISSVDQNNQNVDHTNELNRDFKGCSEIKGFTLPSRISSEGCKQSRKIIEKNMKNELNEGSNLEMNMKEGRFQLKKTGVKLVEDNRMEDCVGQRSPESHINKRFSVKEIRENLIKTLENETSFNKSVGDKPPLKKKPAICKNENKSVVSKAVPLLDVSPKPQNKTPNHTRGSQMSPQVLLSPSNREEIYDEVENVIEVNENNDFHSQMQTEIELYDTPESGNKESDEVKLLQICDRESSRSKSVASKPAVSPKPAVALTMHPMLISSVNANDDIYDDVVETAAPKETAGHTKLSRLGEKLPSSSSADVPHDCVEFYEDVISTTKSYSEELLESSQLPPAQIPPNSEPSVAQVISNDSFKYEVSAAEDELYEDVASEVCPADKRFTYKFLPQKPLKSFGKLDAKKFEVPYGLDAWLYQVATANQSKFVIAVNLSSCTLANNTDNSTDVNSADYNSDNVSLQSIGSRNDNKKDLNKLKKQENDRRKKVERMKKDLKSFKLDPNEEPVIAGNVVANSECKGSKRELAYKSGDEISILQTKHQCPDGKALAMNSSTMRVGYISKEEFQLIDSYFVESQKNSTSMIPTEDEEIGSCIEAPPVPLTARHLEPPPVPQTPRPTISPGLARRNINVPNGDQPTVEEIYTDIPEDGLIQQEEIYDSIS